MADCCSKAARFIIDDLSIWHEQIPAVYRADVYAFGFWCLVLVLFTLALYAFAGKDESHEAMEYD